MNYRPHVRVSKVNKGRGVKRDKVTIGIATIPERAPSFANVVKSLLPQCDEMHITLNNYDSVPNTLKMRKIKVHIDKTNSMGDNAKFRAAWRDIKGYFLSVDDDLIYPENYVQEMIKKLNEAGRSKIIGLHGTIFREPFENYTRNRVVIAFPRALVKPRIVHSLLAPGRLSCICHRSLSYCQEISPSLWRPTFG